jgi:MFS family permease
MIFDASWDDIMTKLFKKEAGQFFVSVTIRQLALGMVAIFEPIYIYLHFNKSVPHVLLFWSAFSGLFALTVVFGGRIMSKIGLRKTMLLSNVFYFAYYICLFFAAQYPILISVALLSRAIGASLFWPAFHTDFVRIANSKDRAENVGKMSFVGLLAGIIGPVIGGLILAGLGYLSLFTVVLVTLLTSNLPLLMSQERYENYTDTYKGAWKRMFKNKDVSISLASLGVEGAVDAFVWPIFIFTLGLSYRQMGAISTFTILISAMFAWYMGKIASRQSKFQLLNIGSMLLSLAWAAKLFVVDVASAFFGQTIYMITKTATMVPFRTILYNKASSKRGQADEFIIYREIIINLSRFLFLLILAGVFYFVADLKVGFVIAIIASLGFSFLAKPYLVPLMKKK